MSRRRKSTRVSASGWTGTAQALGRQAREIARYPVYAGLIGVTGLALVWLVLTSSLPYALANARPDLALLFSPNNPAALMTQAQLARSELSLLLGSEEPGSNAGTVQRTPVNQDSLARLPEVRDSGDMSKAIGAERDRLRKRIGELAKKIITQDPLNATAYRLLAEATDDPDAVRALMQEAVKRSRRETVALFWLMNDAFNRQDFATMIQHADMLMRVRAELNEYVTSYLGQALETDEGRALVHNQLLTGPKWRKTFLHTIHKHVKMADTPLKLMLALRDQDQAPTPAEYGPYLDFLLANQFVELAYSTWLQLQPNSELEKLGLVTNSSFERDPSGQPFDWKIANGRNARLEFVPQRDLAGNRALHITFGSGRVMFPELTQVVLLVPGKYVVEGSLRGTLSGKRGLRWQLRCLHGERKSIGETEMLLGQAANWRTFSFEAVVAPTADNQGCSAQLLRLFHDSRSSSEEFIAGEAWFDDIKIKRLPD
jgi:hypothetical protein